MDEEKLDQSKFLAERFEGNRARLRAVAYRMLGSRKSRREEPMGPQVPEPAADDAHVRDAEMADSVGAALLVVLETLAPAERLAFVLHDMFAVPFEEIAPIVGRTPAAARQLASRGRRRVQGAEPNPDTDVRHQREIVDAFLAAARGGDFDALLSVLDPDVVFRADPGKIQRLARPPITGATAVATELLSRAPRFAPLARPALVNGTAGLVVGPVEKPFAVVGFTVARGRIVAIDLITNPD